MTLLLLLACASGQADDTAGADSGVVDGPAGSFSVLR